MLYKFARSGIRYRPLPRPALEGVLQSRERDGTIDWRHRKTVQGDFDLQSGTNLWPNKPPPTGKPA